MRRLALFLGLLALAACGGGEDDAPAEAPDDFAVRIVRLLTEGKPAEAWDRLHPAQQEDVPRALFVGCQSFGGGKVEGLQVGSLREGAATVPGGGEADTTVVPLSFTLAGSPAEVEIRVVEVGGDWRWVLTADEFGAYDAGRCPS